MAMNIYNEETIGRLLEKFMDGGSTLDEERLLGDYFRNAENIPEDWEDYRKMFAFFDGGMVETDGAEHLSDNSHEDRPTSNGLSAQKNRAQTIRRWAVAAAVAMLLVLGGEYLWEKQAEEPETFAKAHVQKQAADNLHNELCDSWESSVSVTAPSTTPHKAKKRIHRLNPLHSANRLNPLHSDERLNQLALQAMGDEAELNRKIRLQQAKIDSEIAVQTAEACMAEYYAQQLANGEEMAMPAVNLTLGDDYIPQDNIMTLIMQ